MLRQNGFEYDSLDFGQEPFGPYLNRFLEDADLSRSTKATYGIESRLYVLPTFEHSPIASITPADVRSFVADLQRVLDVTKRGFSSVWISDHLMFEAKFRMECWTQLVWVAAPCSTTTTTPSCSPGFRCSRISGPTISARSPRP